MSEFSQQNVNLPAIGVDLTESEYIQRLVSYTQSILNRTFSANSEKRTIRVYKDRINFACPLCGDSGYNVYKKRGNIILSGKFAYRYKCHNCGATMPVDKFLEQAKLGKIDSDMVVYVKKHIHRRVSLDASMCTADVMFDVETIEDISVDRDAFKTKLLLQECDGVTDGQNRGFAYITGRMQYDYKKFLYDERNDKLYILNLTPSGKIFGCQIRELDNRRAERYGKYKTFSVKKVHSMLMHDNIDDEEFESACNDYEQVSMIFNVMLVNYEKPIYVTEGPMDALMIKNAIALCGGSKTIELDAELYYVYDSDQAGVKYAVEKVRSGGHVFMWRRFLADMQLPTRNKWDWNDVVLYTKKPNIVPDIEKYFTKDKFDIMDL